MRMRMILRWILLLCGSGLGSGSDPGLELELELPAPDTQRDPGTVIESLRGRGFPRVERTVPYIIVDGDRRRLDTAAFQVSPPVRLLAEVRTRGRKLRLELERNQNLLPIDHHLVSYLPNGSMITDRQSNPVNCYYHGRIRGFPESWVSVSICSGMRGVLAVSPSWSVSVAPAGGGAAGAHLVTPVGVTSRPRGRQKRCAVGAPPQRQQEDAPPLRQRRETQTEPKFVELVMVADSNEFRRYGHDLKTVQMRMLEIANQVDALYRPLRIRVVLVGVEVWSQGDPFAMGKSPEETLRRFLEWRESDLVPRIPHDNAQLLTGNTFPGGMVGMASQSSMCSKDRSGGINVDHSVSVLAVASTVAHEIGHNLGIGHDVGERGCSCPNPRRVGGCIMEASTGFLPGQAFSSCSRVDLERSLRNAGALCLYNFPPSASLYGAQLCGNLYLEEGEQCDCGLAEECADPCCNATTCMLVPGAQCSTDGACCDNCQLQKMATLCRPPLGDCDLPEYCNGSSPFCPPNVYLSNGLPCANGRAYCYNGACLTYEAQCEVLWGPGSARAADDCFAANQRGDRHGNCGLLANGSFRSCAQEDTVCGTLQCEGGGQLCRGANVALGDDVTEPGLAQPGTRCGARKVCIDRKCQDDSVLDVERCTGKCNGHGRCNSNGHCHCDAGWAPPHCEGSGYGGSVDSGPVIDTRGNHSLLVALLLTLLLIAMAALCYWKRDVLRRELDAFCAQTQRRRDSRVENGSRVHSEGRMRYKPPDRLETELRPARNVKPRPPPPLRSAPSSIPLPPKPKVNVRQPRPRLPERPPPVASASPRITAGPSTQKSYPPRKPLPRDPGFHPVARWSASAFEDGGDSDYCSPPTRPPPPPPGKDPRLPPHPSSTS